MISFLSIEKHKNPDEGIGFVVLNNRERVGHDFTDLFPYVTIDGEIYTTRKVTSSQLHVVKPMTRILIYVHEHI